MSDDADFAGALIDRETAALIERHQHRAGLFASADANTERDCRMCGHAIPAARLAVLPGAVRCVRCEDVRERAHA